MMKHLVPFVLFIFAAAGLGQQPVPNRATGYKPPTPAQRAAAYADARAAHGGRMRMLVSAATLPSKFDAREMGWVPPVGDQGSCGSCYLYSTTMTASSALIKAGYGKADGSFILAVQFGMDCERLGGCGGGWGIEVIKQMMQDGWPAEKYIDVGAAKNDYPSYIARSSNCRKVAGAKYWGKTGTPTAFTWGFCTADQTDRTPTTEEVKTALMNYGPLNVALDAGGQF